MTGVLYEVVDHTDTHPREAFPAAEPAFHRAQQLAAALAAAQGLPRIVRDHCPDGVLLFGTDLEGVACEPLVWVGLRADWTRHPALGMPADV